MDFTEQNMKQIGGPIELNFEGLDIQKWNVPTDIAQRVDAKNGVLFLITMFTQEDLSVALKCFVQTVTNFLVSSTENTKKSHVIHFNNHHINPIFFIYSLSFISWLILSLHSKNLKIPFPGSPICFMFCPVKYTFTCQWWLFEGC